MKLPVKIKILDSDNETEITNDIEAFTENVSKAGMRLNLPVSWDCPECNNCLGWIYNLGCKLKNNHTEEENRFFSTKFNLKVTMSNPSIPAERPVQLEGSLVWINTNIPPKSKSYSVGVSFSESSQKGMTAYIPTGFNQ